MNDCKNDEWPIHTLPMMIGWHPIHYKLTEADSKKYDLEDHKEESEVSEAVGAIINQRVNNIKDIFNDDSDGNATDGCRILLQLCIIQKSPIGVLGLRNYRLGRILPVILVILIIVGLLWCLPFALLDVRVRVVIGSIRLVAKVILWSCLVYS